MTIPVITRTPDGSLRLGNLSLWFTTVLLELDELLDPNQPERVKRRLYPAPSDDLEETREWERLVHPDLFALVASAREVVREDLRGLEASLRPVPTDPDEEDDDDGVTANAEVGWRLVVPAQHVNAWISALQTARLTLSELHDVGEGETRLDELDPDDPKTTAIARMQTYAWILEMILAEIDPELGRS